MNPMDWEAKGHQYLDALSDKIRTMSLGTLAFVWALLTAESATVIKATDSQQKALMWIAAGGIAMLAVDLLEYVAAYCRTRQLNGHGFPIKCSLSPVRWTLLGLKLVSGTATVVGLVIVLSLMLSTKPIEASADNAGQLIGAWCGDREDYGTPQPTFLEISASFGKLGAKIGGERNSATNCQSVTPKVTGQTVSVEMLCSGVVVQLEKKGSRLIGTWQRNQGEVKHHGKINLYSCHE
jgi:hypothetical protein